MSRVLLGAILGAAVGGIAGWVPSYRNVEARPASGPAIDVSGPLNALSKIAGACAGSVVGAIAGAVSTRGEARPLPLWFWVTLAACVLALAALAAVWFLMPSAPKAQPRGEDVQPAGERAR